MLGMEQRPGWGEHVFIRGTEILGDTFSWPAWRGKVHCLQVGALKCSFFSLPGISGYPWMSWNAGQNSVDMLLFIFGLND